MDNLSSFTLANIFNLGWTEIGGLIIAGIAIGTLVRGRPELAILIGFVTMLMLFVADMIGVVTYANLECGVDSSCRWGYYVVILIIVPFLYFPLSYNAGRCQGK